MARRRKRTTSRPEGASVPPKPAVAPATPGGPNRQARKEEARRQREALQRKMSRRRAYRVVSVVVAFLLVAGGIVAFVALRPSAAEAAGCGPVRVIPPYNPSSEDRTHIGQAPVATPPPLSSYQSVPPVSGPHDPPPPQPAGVYTDPPPIYKAIHSLEHAGVIVWYRPGTTSSALADIQDFYRDTANNDHVIVAPYSYPDQGAQGTLPAGKQMVLVAWHHLQSCTKLSLAVVKGFVDHYRLLTGQGASAAYKGDAPEPGAAM
jgi:hypothetical protein